jgi:hypothetical protein
MTYMRQNMAIRRTLAVALCMFVVFTLAGTAQAKPWVRKAALDGRYSGKIVPQNCTWVPTLGCEDWWYRYRVTWDFTPTSNGARFRWALADRDVRLRYVKGKGYYVGRYESPRGRFVTRYKLWVTQQIRVDGDYVAYKIKGTQFYFKKSAPATHHSLATYTLVRKGG